MNKLWPKVIRDPVHNIIPFEDTPCDRLLLDLINSKEFQRLRRIKQLGMSELVFPGANHTRFAHSIGVMHVARRMMDHLSRLAGRKIREDQRIAVLVAALLHDVGHGPFSHAFEKVTGQDHEARTLQVIQTPSTEINDRLRRHDKRLPDRLAVFFDEDIDAEKRQAAEIPDFLTQVVSSQLDADRFDYLLRDCYATGTDYGRYDLAWLMLQLRFDAERKRLFLGRKALDAAEAYVFARYHMYRAVYFHKTVRAAEVMVRLALLRFKELVRSARTQTQKRGVVPEAPPHVLEAFAGTLSLDRYLSLDDQSLNEFFKACSASKDELLRLMGGGLIHRRLYKATDATGVDTARVAQFFAKATRVIEQKKLDPRFCLVDDTAADTPYKPYDPDEGKPASQIYVEISSGKNAEISTQSDAIDQLRKEYSLLRYYFPESVRDRIDLIAKEAL